MYNTNVARAVQRIREAVHAETGPGSYRDSWLANIAMPILDQQSLDLRSPNGAHKMAEILLEHFFPKLPDPSMLPRLSEVDEAIVLNKQLRADLDEILQVLKAADPSRNRAIAITHLEDVIMRLGMDLKALNESRPKEERAPSPYPSSYDPSNTRVEPTADGLKL